ncbi:hypothetical protein AB0B63_06905 [Micromonospora sp. NPDC049081]|uniref:hypothetical protein n=1 Tax=Micromonospora sp. NPDC049081 TaxID=3155150 RepID=UPI0033C166E6
MIMRAPAEYIAQQPIQVNGVRAYNPGDDVPASAVENLGLTVGEHVLPAHPGVIERPAGNARRADWEVYWLGQGMTREEIDGMTRDELAAREPEVLGSAPNPNAAVHVVPNPLPDVVAAQATEQTAEPVERPGQNARKADWVEYAVWRGMPRETAEDSTIPQLADADYDTLFGPEQS